MQNNENSNSFLTGAIVGAFVGAIAALLLSPSSGAENRKLIAKTAKKTRAAAEDMYEDVTEKYEDFRDSAEDYIHEVERRSAPIKKQASRMAIHALDSAEDTIKDTKKKFFKGVKL